MRKAEFLKKVDLVQYIYLNHFCKNVIRKGKGKIVPYKHSVFSFEKNAKIILNNVTLETNSERLPDSKTETLIRLREDATWNLQGSCTLNYGCTVEIVKGACIDSQYFTMNTNSTIVCAKHIMIGSDVMIGRNVVIYDSDFHHIIDDNDQIINDSEETVIGNHVWVCTNALILKGSNIGDNTIVSAGSIVTNKVDSDQIIRNENKTIRLKYSGRWKR